MRPKPEEIPGQRQPTAQEHARIAALWGYEIDQRMHKSKGNIPRYFGIFLIITSISSATRPDPNMGLIVAGFIFAFACMAFSSAIRKASGLKDSRLMALKNATYSIAPAHSWDILYGQYQSSRRTGLVRVRLAGGQILDGVYKIPYRCAEPLLRQKIKSVPLFLIIIPGDPEILAIPVQDIN